MNKKQKVFPNYMSKAVGTTVKFTCRTKYPVQWKFEKTFPDNVKIIKNVLKIENIQRFNEGRYDCTGINKDKSYFKDWAVLIVTGKKAQL